MNELQLQVHNTSAPTIWDDKVKVQEIRKVFAPKLSDTEFQIFVGLGKATNLNPFTREIWAVKYAESSPAQIFIGRDGYRKAAQGHAEYDYHQADAVYDQDTFEVVNGEIRHSYSLANRGNLVGAYCISKRHKSSRPIYVFAELREYTTGKSVWKDKPATMIKKVAESQCLRACFQDLLGGTYGEEEMEKVNNPHKASQSKDDLLSKIKKQREPIDVTPAKEAEEVAAPAQIKQILNLVTEKNFSTERFDAALTHYGVEKMGDLTTAQAQDFIAKLNKL